jgi:hypothetical protein
MTLCRSFARSGDNPRVAAGYRSAPRRGVGTVVADHARNAKAIVAEHAIAAGRLDAAVAAVVAPVLDGFLIAPDRQRQHLVGVGDGLEALNRDEAVHLLQLRFSRAA